MMSTSNVNANTENGANDFYISKGSVNITLRIPDIIDSTNLPKNESTQIDSDAFDFYEIKNCGCVFYILKIFNFSSLHFSFI